VSNEKDQEAVEDRSRTRRVEEGERRMEQRRCNPPMELA
jgi:hypothetical protein